MKKRALVASLADLPKGFLEEYICFVVAAPELLSLRKTCRTLHAAVRRAVTLRLDRHDDVMNSKLALKLLCCGYLTFQHIAGVLSAQFSPNGQNIVSASEDKTVRVWSAATGECVQTLAGHSDGVRSAQFSPEC